MIDFRFVLKKDGESKLEFFSDEDKSKKTERWFHKDSLALGFAAFVAAEHGVKDSEKLRAFLKERDFPDEMLNSLYRIDQERESANSTTSEG